MKNSGPITKVSLLLGTIICLGAFFLVDNNIPVQALHKEEQILDDYDDLAEFANAVRNGDEDIEEIPIESMEAADIYDDADDSMKDCIDLAGKVGDSLSDREVIHCVDDVNYFNNKYSNSSVPTNATFDTSTTPTDTDTSTGTDATSTSDTSTPEDATSTSDTSTPEDATSTSDTSTPEDATSTSDTSTSDNATSTSDTSTSDNLTENNLINELVNTGKFTEDEAKEFVSKNMLSGINATTTSGDTQATTDADTSTDDTQATTDADTSTDDTQATTDADTSTNDTSSSGNESNDDDSSSSNTNNPEEY